MKILGIRRDCGLNIVIRARDRKTTKENQMTYDLGCQPRDLSPRAGRFLALYIGEKKQKLRTVKLVACDKYLTIIIK